MKKFISLLMTACLVNFANAQDDLLQLLEEAANEPKTEYISNTFKAVRIVNSHSVEMPSKKNLQFVIQHRFGRVDEGWRNFFGIDNASMRIGMEFGIFNWWSAGWGRSSAGGIYDFYTRFKILRQSKGVKRIPFSMAWYSNMGISSQGELPEGVDKVHRLSYAHQLMIARKFTRIFSFQVMPTYTHKNVVPTANDKNDVFAVGFGARCLVSRNIGINLEYFQPVTKREDGELYIGSMSFALDIETGGHVFQIVVSNSTGLIEQVYIPDNTGHWWDKEIHLGFNINRNIILGKRRNKSKVKDKDDKGNVQ